MRNLEEGDEGRCERKKGCRRERLGGEGSEERVVREREERRKRERRKERRQQEEREGRETTLPRLTTVEPL